MDPPPLPPSTTIAATTIHLNYSDSVDSFPGSHTDDTFYELLPHIPGAKLRLMCSYGGHIIPRPHDKTLCYVGGETRMVSCDRHSSISSLTSRLARTLLHGRPFTLKYQLPHEDLDSLVSVTTDEDLDNMIEEYDRINASSSTSMTPHRIRLFLFFNKPETAASMGSLLDDAKSETWFVDALNGSLIPRNLSDTAAIDCLVNLDSDVHDLEAQAEGEMNKQEIQNVTIHHDQVQDHHSSPSSSSSPSMCNLPPIRVRVEDHQRVGVEEQFTQMCFAQVVQKQDDHGYNSNGLNPAAALPPLPTSIAAVGMVASLNPSGDSSENLNRILSDDERSDHGAPVSFRKKPPLSLQPVQHKPGCSNFNLPSPDSVTSDTSIASANSLSKSMCYQEQIAISPDAKSEISIPSSQIQVQQPQNSRFLQFDQQQYIQSKPHIIPHTATTPLPNISSYYAIYAAQSQQQPHQPVDQHKQYPFYVMPVAQTQQYMLGDTATVISPGRATTPAHPPVYPTTTTLAKPETPAVYRTAVPSTHSFVPIPGTQFQKQYVGYAQMQHPSQSISVVPAANYGFECGEGGTNDHQQVYYSQVQAANLLPEYLSMSPAAAVALAEASSNQLPTNTIHQSGNSQSQAL